GSHPGLDRAEGMLVLAPVTHLLRMLVEPALNGFENVLMFPSRDPSLLCGGAAVLDGAASTGVGPVTAQDQSVLLVSVVVGELLSGRTNVSVLLSHVTEILFAEAPFRLCVRGHWLWQRDRDACFLARQDLLAAEVAAVGDGIEVIRS